MTTEGLEGAEPQGWVQVAPSLESSSPVTSQPGALSTAPWAGDKPSWGQAVWVVLQEEPRGQVTILRKTKSILKTPAHVLNMQTPASGQHQRLCLLTHSLCHPRSARWGLKAYSFAGIR